MAEINVRIEVPVEMKDKFELALDRVIKQFVRRIRFAVIDDIMSKSELTDKQIEKLSSELKERAAKKHGPL